MGRFLVFAMAGFGVAFLLDSQGRLPFVSGLGGCAADPSCAPSIFRTGGFVPLETPRSTLPNASEASQTAARDAYLLQGRAGMGEIDFFLS